MPSFTQLREEKQWVNQGYIQGVEPWFCDFSACLLQESHKQFIPLFIPLCRNKIMTKNVLKLNSIQ